MSTPDRFATLVSIPAPPTRIWTPGAQLRRLLETHLRTDAELETFCLQYFLAVQRQFSAGMNRTQKLNILLGWAETSAIMVALDEYVRSRLQPMTPAARAAGAPESKVCGDHSCRSARWFHLALGALLSAQLQRWAGALRWLWVSQGSGLTALGGASTKTTVLLVSLVCTGITAGTAVYHYRHSEQRTNAALETQPLSASGASWQNAADRLPVPDESQGDQLAAAVLASPKLKLEVPALEPRSRTNAWRKHAWHRPTDRTTLARDDGSPQPRGESPAAERKLLRKNDQTKVPRVVDCPEHPRPAAASTSGRAAESAAPTD